LPYSDKYIAKAKTDFSRHEVRTDRRQTGSPSRDVKGKAIPLQALTGPESSKRLKLPDFKTTGT
jgi:hypothetical protein